jgi:hypothetical protein
MEPISFALALGSIPGIFTSCVECYQYIQFGREFEKDFEMALCKLEAAELRLTRWGISMGIESPETKLCSDDYNDEDIKKAYHWLKEIKNAFDSAIETSARYRTTAKPDKLHLLDTDAEIRKGSNALQALHNNMHRLNYERVKPRKRDRISWALYRKGNFENLIENISDLTNNLVDLFPSTIDAQKQLCKNEVKDMDIPSLALLDKAIGVEDEILKPILQAEVEQRPNFFSNIDVRDHFRGHFGDNVAPGENSRSGLYSHINAGGDAVAHFGSNIGNFQGKTVFDSPQNW